MLPHVSLRVGQRRLSHGDGDRDVAPVGVLIVSGDLPVVREVRSMRRRDVPELDSLRLDLLAQHDVDARLRVEQVASVPSDRQMGVERNMHRLPESLDLGNRGVQPRWDRRRPGVVRLRVAAVEEIGEIDDALSVGLGHVGEASEGPDRERRAVRRFLLDQSLLLHEGTQRLGRVLGTAALDQACPEVVVGAVVDADADRKEARELAAIPEPALGIILRDGGRGESQRGHETPELEIPELAGGLPLCSDLPDCGTFSGVEEVAAQPPTVADERGERAPRIPRPVRYEAQTRRGVVGTDLVPRAREPGEHRQLRPGPVRIDDRAVVDRAGLRRVELELEEVDVDRRAALVDTGRDVVDDDIIHGPDATVFDDDLRDGPLREQHRERVPPEEPHLVAEPGGHSPDRRRRRHGRDVA